MNRALIALVAMAAPSAAEPAFGWRAPASCPRAEEIKARVERRLGAPIDGAVHGIEIEITRDGTGFVAQIDARALTVANDVRTLRSARCEELADAIAVIIARLASQARHAEPSGVLAVEPPRRAQPVVAVDQDARDARDEIDQRGPADEERADVQVRAPVITPPRRWGGGVRLLALSGVGALPRINLGGELAGYVRREHHFVELAVGRWVPQSARLDPGAPARVDVSLDVVTVRGGYGPEHLPIRAWVSAEIGRLQGAGMAVVDPQVGSGRWVAVGGGFGVAWPMAPHARLVGTFELAIPLERTRFMLQNGGDLYQPAAAAARCALGLELGWR
ncbi:MAG: hypothetical protein IPQ07_35740 [Myxococcales bacterium]|nr:hypothetical protein [Myxococcales bacterium]